MHRQLKLQTLLVVIAFAASFMAVFVSVQNARIGLRQAAMSETIVRGLEPGSKISYIIVPKTQKEELSRDYVLSDTLTVNDKGIAYLPSFSRDFRSYNISFNNQDKPIVLNVSYNQATDRLNIKGSGFEKFTDVFIEKDGQSRQAKTDWAGLLSEYEILGRQNFANQRPIKLAFNSNLLDDSTVGKNPLKVEVVINQGGGAGPADVNVYDPRIHEYNCGEPIFSTDGDDTFYVSTCDQAIMQAQMNDGFCSGGPPCTSSADTLEQLIVHPLMLMGEQLSAVMMQQMFILGSLIDAKEQNEAHRDFRHMVAQAHKDYHPSEQMCRFGSYIRSLSHTEESASANKKAFNQILSTYSRSMDNLSSSEGYDVDMKARVQQFKDHYCNPNDNAGALWQFCRGDTVDLATPVATGTAAERLRFNKDIDYFNTLDKPLTLDVNLTNAVASNDEEDLIALAKNLYWPSMYNFALMREYENAFADNYPIFLKTRNIIGKMALAHNSFAHIVGMKSRSENELAAPVAAGGSHMKALLREFGLTDPDIELLMGDNPSYYAQMEILAKKIYQNPTFYTNLYDKPVNVDRINTTLEAFQNMHTRDRFESQLRQEMLISMLVEDAVEERVREINSRIPIVAGKNPKTQQGTGY